MARRSRHDPSSFLGLDSFMDIVTNVIGALFFVVIFAALVSFDARARIRTPVASIAETERVLFETRNGTVFRPDLESLTRRSNEVWSESEGRRFEQRVALLRQANIRNDYYTYVPSVRRSGNRIQVVDLLRPVEGARGETAAELVEPLSEFRAALAELEPAEQHIIFFVRTNSFEVFHTARRVALDLGFKVGWEPMPDDESITFVTSSSGEGRDLPVF